MIDIDAREGWLIAAVCVIVLYVGAANAVFAFRHPWAATGHRLHCIVEIATFQRVERADCGE